MDAWGEMVAKGVTGMDVENEAQGSVNCVRNVGFTLRLETKAQDTLLLLPCSLPVRT